jgi:hypothetical protein
MMFMQKQCWFLDCMALLQQAWNTGYIGIDVDSESHI